MPCLTTRKNRLIMTRNVVSFLVGLLVGVGATICIIFVGGFGLPDVESDIEWFDQPGSCLTQADLKVFRTLGPNRALVGEEKDLLLELPVMLLIADGHPHFYDEQIIKMPAGACAKHVGNFNYKTKDDSYRTVPVVSIDN